VRRGRSIFCIIDGAPWLTVLFLNTSSILAAEQPAAPMGTEGSERDSNR
jgi:hypothetical protein